MTSGLLLGVPGFDFSKTWVQALAGVIVIATVALTAGWRAHCKQEERLEQDVRRAREDARAREVERDAAQAELLLRLEQERELNKQQMQLQAQLANYEKAAALAQMALGAAHEINNPLLGILSHLELELKSAGPETRAEIEQCIESGRRISDTTRGLLNYARPDPLRVSRVQLPRLMGELLSFLEHQPMLRALKVENWVRADIPPIYADAQQVSQVLTNVLLNAAQATPGGGTISIDAEMMPAADMVEIRIRDTGTGIPADILPHVFEPFFTTKRGQGTGLGLSISQTYVRRHGGEIRMESKEGEGTTVRITLPMRGQAAPAGEEGESEVIA
ncbi:MAG TPA: ATP-binding protein [Terriglobales bacterium]|nr:ATP-binding protein [Terriglobales bacterium]